MLIEPNCWMILLVSFLETWRELALVHHMVKKQLLLHCQGPQHCCVHSLGTGGGFLLLLGSLHVSTTLLVELIGEVT